MKYIVFILCCFVGSVFASTASGKEKTVMCAACHGESGYSTNDAWPHLAGQHKAYLVKQLHDFKKNESRHSPVMMPFSSSLTEEDIEAIALFYAKQTRPPAQNVSKNEQGARLYRLGDSKKGIAACIACHGPNALGNPLAGFPLLANQKAEYTFLQLKAFKDKARQNDLNAIMQTIAGRMDEDDMRAVSIYLSQFSIQKKDDIDYTTHD